MGSRTVQLTGGRQSRAGAIAIAATGAVLALACFAAALGPHTVPGQTIEELALALAFLLGFGWWARRVERKRRPGPRALTVAEGHLVIDHPVALDHPLQLHRTAIRAIQIDTTGDPTGRHPIRRTFTWSAPTPEPDGLTGALWTPDHTFDDAPVVGNAKDIPNIAIVLDGRMAPTGLRRPRGLEHHPISAILLSAADPEAAASAFAGWEDVVVAELTTEHFAPRPPEEVAKIATAAAPPAPEGSAAEEGGAAGPAAAATLPAPEEGAPARPAATASPRHSVPPPAPRHDVSTLALPTPRSPARTQATAALLALGFAVPFALITGGLLLFGAKWFVDRGPSIPAIAMLVIGFGLVRVAWPRSEEAPGVPVAPGHAPELQALIAETAAAIGTAPPRATHVDFTASARIDSTTLVLGLPLLAALDRDQLRAVIAHELAHAHLKHTAAGTWIAATFRTLGRVHGFLCFMERRALFAGLLAAPLRHAAGGYSRLAGRVARDVTRGHEVAADELAARVAGPTATACALERLLGLAGAAVDDTWFRDVLVPAFESGRRPPILAGFAAHLAEPDVRAAMAAAIAAQRHDTALHPGAVHPPLGARLAIVRAQPSPARAADQRPATTLLPDRTADDLEQALLARFAGPDRVARLAPERAAAA
jgi:Zn-dependent protease with chaperone function